MSYNDDWGGRPSRRPRTLWSDLGGLWARFRSQALGVQLLAAAVVVVVILALLASRGGDGGNERVASRSTTTRPTIPPPTTTTIVLPPGDDGVVRTVLDGDSFELADGTKIRLLGIDAPDTETDACFSMDATAHLRRVLPDGTTVRLVYDQTRTDRLNRTLAYVYRVPDGLFVNVAVARDGFAVELRTPPNTLHADEIATAVNEARTANRGLHQVCSTSTTAARSTTTAGATAATTAAPATTTTTAGETTTTSTTVAATTTSTVVVVQRGVICAPAGATAVFSDGSPAVCKEVIGLGRVWASP